MTTRVSCVRLVRLSALAVGAALLVLGTAAPASAQCAAPTYHGGLPVRVGACPEGVAGGASGGVWAVVVLAAGLWIAYARTRSRATTDADLDVIDAVFGEAAATAEAGGVGEGDSRRESPPPPGAGPTKPGPGETPGSPEVP